jgi:hypothetical protein
MLPITEILIVPEALDDGSLQIFSVFMFIYLVLTFFILYSLKVFGNYRYIFFKQLISDNLLIIISLISFSIFLLFALKYIHNIPDILLFASKYRQGFYKGSGIFTYPILIILPSILALIVIKQYKLGYGFYIALFFVLLASIIVGLRIYLFPIIFLLLIRLLIFSSRKKLIAVISIIFFLMFLYKYFLNPNVEDMNFLEITGYMLGRSNFRSILDFSGFQIGFDDLKCMIYPVNQIFDCSTADFKENFLSYNPKIPIGMPFIALYSGVAIAIPKILYNLGSPIFLSVIVLCVIIIIYLLFLLLRSSNIWTLPILTNMFIISVMALLEDIGALNKILPMLFISICISILFFIENKKIIFKKDKLK